MFEVLAYVFDNYWRGDACPALPVLQRKLYAVGFDNDEVQEALIWLEELKSAACSLHVCSDTHFHNDANLLAPKKLVSLPAMRIFTAAEHVRLGSSGWGFLTFLVSIGVLPWDRLELVMERAMATGGDTLSIDDLKLIVLLVFWSLGEEPDALVLDELCDSHSSRLGH